MKNRGILYTNENVTAIQEGRKTETRRIMDPQPERVAKRGTWRTYASADYKKAWEDFPGTEEGTGNSDCPYGDVGDRLWVREEHYRFGRWHHTLHETTPTGLNKWRFIPEAGGCRYADDRPSEFRVSMDKERPEKVQWYRRLGRFMPRKLSRISLEITSVHAERLQDITEAGAIAEGIVPKWRDGVPIKHDGTGAICIEGYEALWEKINGPGSWARNPFVWVIKFKKL